MTCCRGRSTRAGCRRLTANLLLDLAHAAESTHAPDRRGRGGLMTPSVTQMVEESHAMSSRSVRRHASSAIQALQEEAGFGRPAM